MQDLVVATFNLKKGKEMLDIVAELIPGVRLHTLAEYPAATEPEETGTTYKENAEIKSIAALEVTHLPCMADDAGLEIDALDGAPGVYSKRFGGEDLPFDQKIERILEMLKDVEESKRTARFRSFVSLSLPGRATPYTFEGICEGRIATERSGAGGFGYDPIFYLPELDCTMADLTPVQKHAISHRGKVLRKFADFWMSLQTG